MRPSAWMRAPTDGAETPVGNNTSTAADESWTTIRRPPASSRVAGAVTMASIAMARSVIFSARAIDVAEIAAALGEGDGCGEEDPPGDVVAPAMVARSAPLR